MQIESNTQKKYRCAPKPIWYTRRKLPLSQPSPHFKWLFEIMDIVSFRLKRKRTVFKKSESVRICGCVSVWVAWVTLHHGGTITAERCWTSICCHLDQVSGTYLLIPDIAKPHSEYVRMRVHCGTLWLGLLSNWSHILSKKTSAVFPKHLQSAVKRKDYVTQQ